ncbi:MAG: cell division protein ZapA [Bacteroidales bacterium]|nr:cell division protein ZapA [Bacteroidales bacterium]
MTSGDRLPITIEVCGRKFQFTVLPEQEEVVRAAAKSVSQRAEIFKSRMPRKDLTDILSLIAVEFASDAQLGKRDKSESPLVSQIERLNDELDVILSE